MCYIGKATKIFIFLITVLVITGIILGFGVLRRAVHPKSHKCAGESCPQSDLYPPPSLDFPIPSTPDLNTSNPSGPISSPPSPPPPPPTTTPPSSSGSGTDPSPPPPAGSIASPPSASSTIQTASPPPPPLSALKMSPPPPVILASSPPAFSPPSPIR